MRSRDSHIEITVGQVMMFSQSMRVLYVSFIATPRENAQRFEHEVGVTGSDEPVRHTSTT